MNLHDVGPRDDYSYTGEDPAQAGPLSLDYYREKARQFQVTMNEIDKGLRAAVIARSANISPALNAYLDATIAEIRGKLGTIRVTAEAINAGASIINRAGGRFPVLSYPSGLGAAPFVVPAVAIAAIGVAVGVIAWGAQLISGLNARLLHETRAQGLSADQKSKLAEALGLAEIAAGELNPFRSFGGVGAVVKWGGIALVGFLLWRTVAPLIETRRAR